MIPLPAFQPVMDTRAIDTVCSEERRHLLDRPTKKHRSIAAAIGRSRPVQQVAQALARGLRVGRSQEKISKNTVNQAKPAKPQTVVSSPATVQPVSPPATVQPVSPPATVVHPVSPLATVLPALPPPLTPDIVPVSGGRSPVADNAIPVTAKRRPTDYIFGKVIGEGSFSTVYLAKDIHTNGKHAIKVCEKRQIIREKKTKQACREKDALNVLRDSGSGFFVKLYCTFQDAERLYYVMSYASNGELLTYINNEGSCDVACARFYSAEILLALEHLHDLNIVHRDLKPENILLDRDMHIKVADFGCSKILGRPDGDADRKRDGNDGPGQRANTFVGTAQYVSPEMLSETTVSTTFGMDLWALGCIVYQMIAGAPPFRSRSEYLLFKKILNVDYAFPDGFNAVAQGLVQALLVLDPDERLGAKDAQRYTSIRSHPFYEGLDFDTLHTTTPPSIYPYLPNGRSDQPMLSSQYQVPDSLEPGLDDKQFTRLCLDG